MTQRRQVCGYPKCERVIEYLPRKFVWRHVTKGADHAPLPTAHEDNNNG